MICTAPQTQRATTTSIGLVKERQGRQPALMQSTDTPLLDWIASELRDSNDRPANRDRYQARRILEQAFAAVA